MSEIRVTIFGEKSAGKTALAQRIQKWMQFDNLNCYNLDEGSYDVIDDVDDVTVDDIRKTRTPIIITTVDVNRDDTQRPFRIEIHGQPTMYADTEKETWGILGNRGLGATYIVYKPDGTIAAEFVPY